MEWIECCILSSLVFSRCIECKGVVHEKEQACAICVRGPVPCMYLHVYVYVCILCVYTCGCHVHETWNCLMVVKG